MFFRAGAVDQQMSFMYILKNVMTSLSRLRMNARRYFPVLLYFFSLSGKLVHITECSVAWFTSESVGRQQTEKHVVSLRN